MTVDILLIQFDLLDSTNVESQKYKIFDSEI